MLNGSIANCMRIEIQQLAMAMYKLLMWIPTRSYWMGVRMLLCKDRSSETEVQWEVKDRFSRGICSYIKCQNSSIVISWHWQYRRYRNSEVFNCMYFSSLISGFSLSVAWTYSKTYNLRNELNIRRSQTNHWKHQQLVQLREITLADCHWTAMPSQSLH